MEVYCRTKNVDHLLYFDVPGVVEESALHSLNGPDCSISIVTKAADIFTRLSGEKTICGQQQSSVCDKS